jgi:capsular polysaccharide biosynthesis protein
MGLVVGSALLLEIVDSVIVSSSEIENEFRLPVLGSVARIH